MKKGIDPDPADKKTTDPDLHPWFLALEPFSELPVWIEQVGFWRALRCSFFLSRTYFPHWKHLLYAYFSYTFFGSDFSCSFFHTKLYFKEPCIQNKRRYFSDIFFLHAAPSSKINIPEKELEYCRYFFKSQFKKNL